MKWLLVLLALGVSAIAGLWWWGTGIGIRDIPEVSEIPKREALATDFSKTSIDTTKLLSGGPGKDGIPALTEPTFVSIGTESLAENVDGVFIERGNERRFYPFTILVWHEIVNDTVGGEPLLITFCPLCGSAVVFDRIMGDRELTFGVSGLLYESNLVMYDRETESLWPQALGKAVVGTLLGTELSISSMNVISYRTVKEKYPDTKILSKNTGYERDYTLYPYGDYDSNNEIYFPVSVNDTRFPLKTRMYVIPFEGRSYAFSYETLARDEMRPVVASGTPLVLYQNDGEVRVTTQDGRILPGYYEMWFSWAVHHQEDGVIIVL
ncbi:MAG: DUF3179 domain-containing protein [Minisyncoccia bacterium]